MAGFVGIHSCCMLCRCCLQYKTEKDGMVETRVERRVIVSGDGDIDHDAVSQSTGTRLNTITICILLPASLYVGNPSFDCIMYWYLSGVFYTSLLPRQRPTKSIINIFIDSSIVCIKNVNLVLGFVSSHCSGTCI